MEMTLRWYGSGYDTVTLEQIRQIPGVSRVITTLYGTRPGEAWPEADIHRLIQEVEASGLHVAGIESVNVHDAIKAGLPQRDQYIENYITTLERLGRPGYIWFAIILCRYLTGLGQNWPEGARTVLLCLHILRPLWMRLCLSVCLSLFQGI